MVTTALRCSQQRWTASEPARRAAMSSVDCLEQNPAQTFVDEHFAPMSGVAIAAGPVADHTAGLDPEERALVADSADQRRHQFATGRYLARQAMQALGMAPAAIGRSDARAPAWPDCVGSISHTSTLAAAVTARGHGIRGVGIDLERLGRITQAMHARLYTDAERDRYAEDEPHWPCLLFSAKECAYKAVNPICGTYIGFQEVEIDVDWKRHRFAARYIGAHAPNALMNHGDGHFGFFADHVISLLVVRRPTR